MPMTVESVVQHCLGNCQQGSTSSSSFRTQVVNSLDLLTKKPLRSRFQTLSYHRWLSFTILRYFYLELKFGNFRIRLHRGFSNFFPVKTGTKRMRSFSDAFPFPGLFSTARTWLPHPLPNFPRQAFVPLVWSSNLSPLAFVISRMSKKIAN